MMDNSYHGDPGVFTEVATFAYATYDLTSAFTMQAA